MTIGIDERRRQNGATSYAGLRRGELIALRWEDVDLATGVLRVEHRWDEVEGRSPEVPQGTPRGPVPGALRDRLDQHARD